MALTTVVTPSEEFKKRFQSIILSNSLPIVDIRFRSHFGALLYSTRPPVFRRKRDIDNLFLEMNKEITSLMREYLGVGLSKYGPLPSLEILLLDNSLDFFSQQTEAIKDDSFMRRGFWEGLGLRVFSGTIYSRESSKLYKVDRDRNYRVETYQLLESIADFTSSSTKKEDRDKKEENILHHYRYFLPEFCTMLALKQLFKVLEEEILSVRNKLAPVLSNQTFGKIKYRNFGNWISRLVNMNELHFRQQRAVSEMNEKSTRYDLVRELTGILREKVDSKDSGELVHDFLWNIKKAAQFNKSQLEVVKSSFEDLISYKSLRTNHHVQTLLIILTIIGLLLTAIQFIPDAQRRQLFEQINGRPTAVTKDSSSFNLSPMNGK
jgi:hypothetical protein